MERLSSKSSGRLWDEQRAGRQGNVCMYRYQGFSLEKCDQAVMDFLAATEMGKFPPAS